MKKIRRHSLIILGLILSSMVFGQRNTNDLQTNLKYMNTIDATLGGSGLFISLNYSRTIVVKSNYFLNASVGMGSVPFVGGTTIPHQITFNFGKKGSFLEVGLAGTYWISKSNSSGYTETIQSYHLSPILGWRKVFAKRLVFRAYANPVYAVKGAPFIGTKKVTPLAGLSLGFAF